MVQLKHLYILHSIWQLLRKFRFVLYKLMLCIKRIILVVCKLLVGVVHVKLVSPCNYLMNLFTPCNIKFFCVLSILVLRIRQMMLWSCMKLVRGVTHVKLASPLQLPNEFGQPMQYRNPLCSLVNVLCTMVSTWSIHQPIMKIAFN